MSVRRKLPYVLKNLICGCRTLPNLVISIFRGAMTPSSPRSIALRYASISSAIATVYPSAWFSLITVQIYKNNFSSSVLTNNVPSGGILPLQDPSGIL